MQGQQAAASEHDQSVAITTLFVSKYSTTVNNTTIAQLYSRLTKSKLLHRQYCTLQSTTPAITTHPYPNLERWSIYFCTQYTTPSVKYFPSSDLMTVGKGIQTVKIIQSSLLGNVLQPAVTPERHTNNNRITALCPALPG